MKTKMPFFKFAFAGFLLTLVAAPVLAAGPNQATLTSITGDAYGRRAGAIDWQQLEVGAVLSEGDALKTTEGSEAVLELNGAAKTAEIVVRESSEFVFKTFQHAPDATDTTLLDVSLGAVLVKAEKLAGASKFEVKTPTSIVGIRGTTFEVKVSK